MGMNDQLIIVLVGAGTEASEGGMIVEHVRVDVKVSSVYFFIV